VAADGRARVAHVLYARSSQEHVSRPCPQQRLAPGPDPECEHKGVRRASAAAHGARVNAPLVMERAERRAIPRLVGPSGGLEHEMMRLEAAASRAARRRAAVVVAVEVA